MSEVEEIVSKLKEKHGEKYTPVQLNCWANMGQYLIRMNLWTHHKKSHLSGRRDLLMLLASFQGRESPFVPNALIN